jgi:uncharacterized membrane protein
MSNLIITSFRDQSHAVEVLIDLKRRRRDCISDLDRSLIITLVEGRASLEANANQFNGDYIPFAELARSLLSAALALPLTAFTLDTFDDALTLVPGEQSNFQHTRHLPDIPWWEEHFGESFLREVGGVVRAKGTAVLMLLHDQETFWIRRDLIKVGNTMLHTILNAEQNQLIGEILRSGSTRDQKTRPAISASTL